MIFSFTLRKKLDLDLDKWLKVTVLTVERCERHETQSHLAPCNILHDTWRDTWLSCAGRYKFNFFFKLLYGYEFFMEN